MRTLLFMFAAILLPASGPVVASDRGGELTAYIQCVPYARDVSGVQIYGDAHTWWQQAQGLYATGRTPRIGAVMAFPSHRGMRSGHVATVSRVIDTRRILLDHANWSPINGRRGHIEKDALAIDVSPANDWSLVRVWYAPVGDVGNTVWPVSGFIYAEGRTDRAKSHLSKAAKPRRSSPEFVAAFAGLAD